MMPYLIPPYTTETRRVPRGHNCELCNQGHPMKTFDCNMEVGGYYVDSHTHYVYIRPLSYNDRRHLCPTHGGGFYRHDTSGGLVNMCTCGPAPWIDDLMMGAEVALYHNGTQYSIERVDRVIKQGAVIIDGNELLLPVVVLGNGMWFGSNAKRIWDTGGPSKNDMRFEIREITQSMRDEMERRDLINELQGTKWDRKSLNQLRLISKRVKEL